MAENKSAVFGALTESEDIYNKISKNVKDMLASQLQEQVSTQLSEDFDNEDETEEEVIAPEVADDVNAEETENDETGSEGEAEAEGDVAISLDGEEETESTPEEAGAEDLASDLSAEVSVEEPVDDNISDVVADVVDATNLGDEELIQVFKKVTDNTEIEVVKNDDNTIQVSKDGQEYVIKINEDKESFLDSVLSGNDDLEGTEVVTDQPSPEAEGEEEVVYEIVLDGSEEESQNNSDELEETRTHQVGRSQVGKPEGFLKYASSRLRASLKESVDVQSKQLINENETLRVEKDSLLTENAQLKDELEKHKGGLVRLNQYLAEALTLNQKIFHVNKLFCEHATTVDEKRAIVERFDAEEIKTEKDIKNLYKTISNEMKVVVKESVDNKISNNLGSTGESLLNESAQVNEIPGLERIKQLMSTKRK